MNLNVAPVRLAFNISSIAAVDVKSNWLYLAASPASVVRINLDHPSRVEDIRLPRKPAEYAGPILRLFASPNGQAVLALTARGEHFYWSTNTAKSEFKHLPKLKSIPTLCVAYHPTKPNIFLCGARSGVFVVEVDSKANETYFKRDLKSVNQVLRSAEVSSIFVSLDSWKRPRVLATCGRNLLKWDFEGSKSDSSFEALFDLEPEPLIENRDCKNLVVSGEHFGVILPHSIVLDTVEIGIECEHLILTEFYALAISGHQISAVNLLEYRETAKFELPEECRGTATDRQEKTYWVYNEELLMEIKLENEQVGMWKSLAAKSRFKEALQIAETKAQRSAILVMQARQTADLQTAAALYGASTAPLEVVALELMRKTDDKVVIASLLHARLKHTTSRAQQTMLTAWLAELGDTSFIGKKKIAWDVDVVCETLRQQGKFDELIKILTERDIGEAISLLVRAEQYMAALDLLRQHEDLPSVYKHAAILLFNEPQATVESWMRISNLDAARLVPVLLEHSQLSRGADQALRFLKYAIKREMSRPVFDAIVVILGTRGGDELLDFLHQYAAKRGGDLDFALRVVLQHGQIQAAVYLATLMELFEEAVQLCLQAVPPMFDDAVEIADKHCREELRKILLCDIARQLIKVEGPRAAVRFAKILRVDDLLAQFPDFDTLNELAPEIVKSLEQTNARLSSLDAEITESLNASENMQKELQDFKRKPVLVEPGEPCYCCDYPLITRKFVVFPCQHGFHIDCVRKNDATKECLLCSVENLKQIDMPLTTTRDIP